MRLATLIISLVLVVISGVQSCAVAVGGSIAQDLSTAASDKQKAEDLAGAGGLGVFAALLWVVGAGFVMAKPKVSLWVFGIASLLWVGAGAAGFTDAYFWMVASIIFAVMSWRGMKEKRKKDQEERTRYQADIAAAATMLQSQQKQPTQPASSQPPTTER